MKTISTSFFVFICLLALSSVAGAQITITKADVDAAYINSRHIIDHDTLSKSYDLGNASNGQTWDFSDLTFYPATTTRDTGNYVLPAGHLAAAQFPGATVCLTSARTDTADGFTFSINGAEYLKSQNDGVYLLGQATHYVTSPAPPQGYPIPADTTVVAFDRPNGLVLPLPLTSAGSVRTSVDTIDYLILGPQVSTRSFTPSGSGSVTFPGPVTRQALRLLVDETTETIFSTDFQRYVIFICLDGTQIQFHVPDTYTSGSVVPISYDLERKTALTGVEQIANIVPSSFRLSQNYPNPFNPATTIEVDLPEASFVTLKVYSLLGQEVALLMNERRDAGRFAVQFDASNLPSGVYFYRVSAGSFVATKRMTLMK